MARRLNLGWLKPPKVPADGVMSLGDHLRELRYRVVLSAVVILAGMIGCAFFNVQLLDFMLEPWRLAQTLLKQNNPNLDVVAVLHGVTSPLFLILKVCAIGGLVLTSPVWLYQVWAYIRPALLQKEKRYALAFLGAAVPLFLFGVAVAYIVLPQAVTVMMAFTPTSIQIQNLLDVEAFLGLMVQLMLVFGIGFLLPVIVVALNLVGVISGRALKKARSGVIFGCFVFGAAATPGGDPFSMLALAIPMMLLFLGAEAICHVNDRRRERRRAAAEARDAVPALER